MVSPLSNKSVKQNYFLLKFSFKLGGFFGIFPLGVKWHSARVIYSIVINMVSNSSTLLQILEGSSTPLKVVLSVAASVTLALFNLTSVYNTIFRQKNFDDFFMSSEEVDKATNAIFRSNRKMDLIKFSVVCIIFLILGVNVLFPRLIYHDYLFDSIGNYFIIAYFKIAYLVGRAVFYINVFFLFVFTWQLTNNLYARYEFLKQSVLYAAKLTHSKTIENELHRTGVVYAKMFILIGRFNGLFGLNFGFFFCYAIVSCLRLFVYNWYDGIKDITSFGKYFLPFIITVCVSRTN